jgi:hypothetical protein
MTFFDFQFHKGNKVGLYAISLFTEVRWEKIRFLKMGNLIFNSLALVEKLFI